METTTNGADEEVPVPESISLQSEQKQCCSIKTQNNVTSETEELLGSVTTFPTAGHDGHAVRSSARVFHKMRMDSNPLPQPEKIEVKNEASMVNQPKTPSQSKPVHFRRHWNNAERSLFFDALNEHGRDFEQISRFINLKMKRKSPSDSDFKTKDHVRQHYYQIYQKGVKYLVFSEDVKKVAQELYTLINYGEMKRKMVISSEKSFLKLRELVYKGSVTIRSKGKNIKVKTPSCRALRILNQLEGHSVEDVQLPQRIDVALKAADMKSWGYVQGLAQNPRIRIVSLPLQKRLSSVLHTVQLKWQMSDVRHYEKYVGTVIQKHGVQKIGEEIVTQSNTEAAQLRSEGPVLRFMPPRDMPIHRPMIQLNEMLSSYNICLNSYEERIGVKIKGEELCVEKLSHIKDLLKHPSKRMRFDSASEKERIAKAQAKNEEENGLKGVEDLGVAVIDHKSNDSDVELKKKEIKEEETSEVILLNLEVKQEVEEPLLTPLMVALQAKPDEIEKPETPTAGHMISFGISASAPQPTKYKKKDSVINGNHKMKEPPFKPLIDEEMLRKVRKGWTLLTVGDVTIGDLYLMFGSDSRLVLEYEVEEPKEVKSETNGETSECKFDSKVIGAKLKNLLSIASLMESSGNLFLGNYLSNHNCERAVHDMNFEFKTPVGPRNGFDAFNRAMNPRYSASIKAPQSRWRTNLHRPRPVEGQVLPSVSGNHVVRDLYQTPAQAESHTNKESEQLPPTSKDDEITRILEDKIQNIAGSRASAPNMFHESSRSSMRSLLDCFSSSNQMTTTINRTQSISDGKQCEILQNLNLI
jgi:hypothetical protein